MWGDMSGAISPASEYLFRQVWHRYSRRTVMKQHDTTDVVLMAVCAESKTTTFLPSNGGKTGPPALSFNSARPYLTIPHFTSPLTCHLPLATLPPTQVFRCCPRQVVKLHLSCVGNRTGGTQRVSAFYMNQIHCVHTASVSAQFTFLSR